MKKIYVKPCSVCMSMAVENAMLAGSPGASNQNYNTHGEHELNNSNAGGNHPNPAKTSFPFYEED
jgi:hypothetical protein